MSEALKQKVTRAAYSMREALPSKGTSLQDHERALMLVLEAFAEMTDDLDRRLEAIEGQMHERMVHLDEQYQALNVATWELVAFKNRTNRLLKDAQDIFRDVFTQL